MPRFLDGTIADGAYTAPDGDFTVMLPHPDAYEARWMQAKEVPSDLGLYVSFGPAAFDQSIYRVVVYRERGEPGEQADLARIAHGLAADYSVQLQPMTGEPLVLAAEERAEVDGCPAWCLRYTQAAPAGTLQDEASTIEHVSYTVQRGDRVYSTWVQSCAGYGRQRGVDAVTFTASVAFPTR
ncbi:MAG: hypothetical protein AB7O97_16180 [Planctomycetota bacterium]